MTAFRLYNKNNIQSLNGIRGFAVLLVLLSHASNRGINIHPDLCFSGAGVYGVFLFFVLSAFLLTRQFIHNAPSCYKKSIKFVKTYLTRRILRIYPLFIISLFIYFALDNLGLSIHEISIKDIAEHIFLLNGIGIFWTIPIEFQYYLLLPLVFYIFTNIKSNSKKLISTAIFISLWSLFFPPEFTTNVITFLPIFVLGSLAAFASSKIEHYNQTTHNTFTTKIIDLVAIASLITFIISIPSYYNVIFSTNIVRTEFHDEFIFYSILSCTLILSVTHSDGLMKKTMECKFLVFWGNVSFSAYLLHLVIIKFLQLLVLPSPILWLVYMFLTAVVSYLSYKYIELPVSIFKNEKTLSYSKSETYR